MLCYVKGLADIKQFRVALRLKNCYARKMDFWKLVYLKSQLYLIELNWIELSQWTSVSLSGNISGPRLLACSKFCNQFRALCTAWQTCTGYALRITVELQIRLTIIETKRNRNEMLVYVFIWRNLLTMNIRSVKTTCRIIFVLILRLTNSSSKWVWLAPIFFALL